MFDVLKGLIIAAGLVLAGSAWAQAPSPAYPGPALGGHGGHGGTSANVGSSSAPAPPPGAVACPPGSHWVPDGYTRGKFRAGHCARG